MGVFLGGVSPLYAQTGSVSGTARDRAGEPVQYVNVGLEGTALGAASGSDGTFTIAAVPPGSYTLVASSVGHATLRRVVEVRAGAATVVTLALAEVDLELQELEVVGRRATTYDALYSFAATKTATPIVDVPQSISVVTKEVIDDQQLYTLNEVTRNVSGVNTFSGYDDLTARGFRTSSTRLINGLKTEFGFWTSPVLPHLERVEFIKGPVSALFAAANPGGTVNMVTKKPLEEVRQSLSFSAGSFASYRATADFTGPVGGDPSLLYRLNLGFDNAESFRFLQGHKSYLVAPSVSFLPGKRTRVNADLVYSYFDGKLDRGQAIFFGSTDLTSTPISFSLSQPGDFMVNEDFYLTLSLQHAFTSWLSFNTSYLKYRYDEDLSEHRTSNAFLPGDPTVLQLAYIRRQSDLFVDNVTNYLTADLTTGPLKHQALVGFDFFRQESNSSSWAARGNEYFVTPRGDSLAGGGVPDFDLDNPLYSLSRDPQAYTANWISTPRAEDPARTTSYGGYVQDQVAMGPLQVLFGLRQEWYVTRLSGADGAVENVEQTALLPRLGLVYGITDRVNAYATFAQGFEPQSATIIQQPERYGGPFDPETSDLFEVGAKGTFFGHRLLTTTALYQITKRNVLVSANEPGQPDLLEQRGAVRSRGFEVDVVGSLSDALQLTANYALNEAVVTESDDPEVVGRVNENAPRHQGGLWARYTLARGPLGGVGFGAGLRFVTDRNTFEQTLQLPGYALFDASVSYTVERFRITAYADNLTDETYWTGGYNYGRIYPGAPRSFRVKVGYTF